jgi:cytochrome c peroxidase
VYIIKKHPTMKTNRLIAVGILVSTALLFSYCKREQKMYTVSDSAMVPKLPDQVYDYPVSTNDYLATLGRVLFYDKELSQNHNISCGSCHQQSTAFSDNNQRFSKGTNDILGDRNTPSIFPKNGRMFWDGRANNLTDLVFRPIRNKVEMNVTDISGLMDRVSSLDYYAYMFKHAFPGATRVDSTMIKSALTEFLRNFDFSHTKFALSQKGQVNLTPVENDGKDLFMGKAKCANCHHIDGNTGFNGGGGYGVTDQSHNIGLDEKDTDLGVGAITKNEFQNGQFMMPVLLNVENTAPYMHDGRFNSLEEVIEHYNSGIKANPNLDFMLMEGSQPQRLNLTQYEKDALVSFLKTLTDPSITSDPKYSDPFVPRTN